MMRNKLLSTLCLLLLSLASCGKDEKPALAEASRTREIMSTFARLTALAPDQATAYAAVEAGFARLDDVNRLMSDYRADSEIGRLNAAAPGEVIELSPETFHCLRRSLEIAEASGGAFDVTCRPLIMVWREAAKAGRLPTDEELTTVRRLVGSANLLLDAEKPGAARLLDGVQVDLGAIAKGYALDLAAEAMTKVGAVGVLVDIGGDVLAVGVNRFGKPWRVGVQHPFQTGIFKVLELSDKAVATSGIQQRFFEVEGKRYSHIIDPRAGRPAEQAPSVTVIAADGLTADAWATVFSVLGIEEGQAADRRRSGAEARSALDRRRRRDPHSGANPGFRSVHRRPLKFAGKRPAVAKPDHNCADARDGQSAA